MGPLRSERFGNVSGCDPGKALTWPPTDTGGSDLRDMAKNCQKQCSCDLNRENTAEDGETCRKWTESDVFDNDHAI